MPFIETATDFITDAELIRRRRYGVIEASEGRLVRIRLRPWPKWVSLPEALVAGQWHHSFRTADRCRLYFNQPWRFPNFLALPYLLSGRGTAMATVLAALAALDEVARIKRSDAILGDVTNFRISPRLLARHGWQPHKASRWHRHYIKRFYGQYPIDRRSPRESLELDEADRTASESPELQIANA